jgi:hypothetical protein
MFLELDIQRATRQCAVTARKLEPGEAFFSTLHFEGSDVVRRDFAVESWQGPPDGAFGWWKSRVPVSDSQMPKLAPNDVLLELFIQLADQPQRRQMRYVLSLLLFRRRVLRLEDRVVDGQGDEPARLVAYCARNDQTYEVLEVVPDDRQIDVIQGELETLLYADAT